MEEVMAALVFMILGFAVGRVFPVRYKIFNERIQLLCTLVLIFLMGVGLGQRDGFFSGLISLGFTSFLFFLIPTILSIAVVYLLTRWFMDGAGEKSRRDAGGRRRDTKDSDPMVFLALGALLLGIGFGAVPLTAHILKPLSDHTDWLLGLLMFSVGISVGLHRGIVAGIRQHHVKILLIPSGIIAGSLAGGVVCGLLMHYPVRQAVSIAGGLGWYSLAGVSITNLAGAEAGSIAFLSNLMREIGAFFMIPYISRHFNVCTCIAPAAATSEDTTLPMLMRYTNEETVVLSVFNGIICSAAVPVLISFCY